MHLPIGSSLPNAHYRVCIKGIMFNEQGELLLLKTPHGTFDMPGGGLDHGETLIQGLEREISEEIGCKADIRGPICTRTRLHRNGVYYFFIGIACNINLKDFITSDEAESYNFFSKEYLIKNTENNHRLEFIINNYEDIINEYHKKMSS